MIQKIKNLLQVGEQVDALTFQMGSQKASFDGMAKQLGDISSSLIELKEKQKEFVGILQSDVGLLQETKEDFKKELYDFKLLKSQLQEQILKQFEEELAKDLTTNREQLSHDTEEYQKMREQLQSLISKISQSGADLQKFLDIGRQIKKEDFMLGDFAKNIQQSEREKRELLMKIDALERLISKMRRAS
ncbi:hypothetical protein HYV84_05820 [Candidatus Woesearchaeota archaeon]|nr:hypothetical protein [Candidatus Woesearchaeota archaeon]